MTTNLLTTDANTAYNYREGFMKLRTVAVLLLFTTVAMAAPLPNAPSTNKAQDGQAFHRTNDVLFGLVISEPVGLATDRPWIGLAAGVGAGIANEARYGSNFNVCHLAVISAGAFGAYALNKWVFKIHKEKR